MLSGRYQDSLGGDHLLRKLLIKSVLWEPYLELQWDTLPRAFHLRLRQQHTGTPSLPDGKLLERICIRVQCLGGHLCIVPILTGES